MSKTTMHNSEASLEVRDLRDGLSDEKLKKVSGGYIGETENLRENDLLRYSRKGGHGFALRRRARSGEDHERD